MSQQTKSTFVLTDPSEILRALVGLKDVRVLHYQRSGPDVELVIEQVVGTVACPACGGPAQVKERPVVRYVDLPVYGTAMSLAWKKHRMRCTSTGCAKRTWVLEDHRIAAKDCLLTTRAAKWATVQVGTGRTVSEVAAELGCDWHTVNDAVTTYGKALLEADRKRLNKTSAIGLDETCFVKAGKRSVPGLRHHRRRRGEPPDHRHLAEPQLHRGGGLGRQAAGGLERADPLRRPGHVGDLRRGVLGHACPRPPRWSTPSTPSALANRCLDAVRRRVQTEQLGHRGRRDDPLYRARRVLLMGEEQARRQSHRAPVRRCSSWATPTPRSPSPTGSKSACVTSTAAAMPTEARQLLEELEGPLLESRHAARGPKARPDHRAVVRQDLQLPPGQGDQRPDRGAQQPDQARQTHRLRVPQLRELPRSRALLYAGKPNWRVLGSIVVR